MIKKVCVGLVGAGYWGEKLLPKFLNHRDVSLKLVCDQVPENCAKVRRLFPAVPTTDSYPMLLDDRDIEAVVIVTPPATHYLLARQAIQAGKHVWIEKPLALQLDQGREIVELARAKGRVLFVDHTFLYDPAIRKIRELIDAGEIGRVYHVFLQRLNLGRIKRDSDVWWNSAPHDVSILLYLLSSRPRSISSHGYPYLQPGLEDLNMAVLEMDNGISAFIYHNWLYPENTAKLTVVGAKRLLVYEGKFDKRSLVLYDYEVDTPRPNEMAGKLPTTIPSRMTAVRRVEGIYDREPLALSINDFLESVQFGRAPVSDGDFSLQVLAVLEARERSRRCGGKKILVDDSGEM
jgi:predicted dehydrogenase